MPARQRRRRARHEHEYGPRKLPRGGSVQVLPLAMLGAVAADVALLMVLRGERPRCLVSSEETARRHPSTLS